MSLILNLKNFRCFSDKTVIIPIVKGIVLLNGKSGKGKSTIMNAIVYAITGTLKNFSKKKTYVSLDYNKEILIVRNDTKLSVTLSDKEYDGDIAQSKIDNFFGLYFSNVSYIDQLSQYSFVNLTPLEKNEFLRDLLLKEYDIENKLDSINKDIKESKESLIKMNATIETQKNMISKSGIITELDPLILDDHVIHTEEKWVKHEANVCKNIKIVADNIDTLNSKLTNVKESVKLYEMVLEKQKLLKKIKGNSGEYNVSKLKDEMDELEDKISLYTKNKKYTETKNKIKELKESNDSRISTLQKKINSELLAIPKESLRKSIEVGKEILELEPKTEERDYKDDIEKLERQIVEIYKCPNCNETLSIKDNKIDLVKNIQEIYPEKSIEIKKKELLELKKMQKQRDKYVDRYNELVEKFQVICSQEPFIEEMGLDIDELKSNLKKVEDNEKYSEEISRLRGDTYLKRLEKELSEMSMESDSIIYTEEDMLGFTSRMTVIKELLKKNELIEREIEEINKITLPKQSLEELKDKEKDMIDKVASNKDKLEKLKDKYKKLTEWNEKFKSYQKNKNILKDLEELMSSKEKMNRHYDSILVLKDMIKKAESLCIEEFISTLNLCASYYIDEIFEDSISVELKTIEELKNGKDKISLNFSINYKDKDFSLISLSGGENDRLNLCYQIALSDILSSKIILLDECFSSLDQETSNKVIDTIKERCNNKLVICVAHQCVQGLFDFIYEM